MATSSQTGRRLIGRPTQVSAVALGIAAVALGIIGLAEPSAVGQHYLDAVAAIVLGVALLGTGAQLLCGYARLVADQAASAIPAGGIMLAFYLGAAVLVLGVLALLQVHPALLIAVAVLVLGVGVMFASTLQARLQAHRLAASSADETTTEVMQELALAAASPQVGAGLAAIVLGILAVVGFAPIVLTLIAAIVLGVAELLSGAAFGQRLVATVTPAAGSGAGSKSA